MLTVRKTKIIVTLGPATDSVEMIARLIDAGVNLGSAYQNGLAAASSWPGGVSLLNQNSFGSGWEIGAYVFAGAGKFCNSSEPLEVPTEGVGWLETAPPTEADNRSLVLFDRGDDVTVQAGDDELLWRCLRQPPAALLSNHTHTLDVAGGRVRLLVHHDGQALRIVALCSSPLRDVVERALASARFALAGTGVRVVAP